MEPVAIGESKLSPSAAGKKLKQTRLPFQVLSGSPTPAAIAPLAAAIASPTSLRTPSESRKRKPSIESTVAVDALRAAKIGRTSEAKENVKDVGPQAVILLDEDSVPGAGVDDEGSNSRDLVDVRKDGKLVKVSTPRTPQRDGSDGGGEGASDRKIRIKLPMASKKRKSVGGKEGSEKKKKLAKEKKKGKKGGLKEGKGKVGGEITADAEPIAIDDSDLSDDEKEDLSKEIEGQPKVGENIEEKSKEAQEVVQKTSKDKENVKKEESTSEDKGEVEETPAKSEDKVEDLLEIPSETAKSEVTPRRSRGRPSRASKEESEKKKSPKPRRSSAKAVKATKSEAAAEVKQLEKTKEAKETAVEDAGKDDSQAKSSKEANDGSTEKSEEVKTGQPDEPSKTSEDKSSSQAETEGKAKEKAKTPEVESSSLAKTEQETKEQAKMPEVEAKPEQVTKDQEETPEVEAKPEQETRDQEKTPEVEAKPEQEATDQEKTPEVEAKLEQETKKQAVKEAKTPSITESNNKRTRYSRAASAKKSEDPEETPKKESTPEDKKQSSAKGALDKFFAKVQNGSTEEKPKIVVTEEPMEVDTAESRNNNNNSTIASICLDDSDDGENTADAEENAYMLCTPNSKDRTALSGATDNRKLTPKQMARKMEAEKRLALKQQELEERKRKKMEEKEAKQKEREEQERLRKKEKEEKEEQKRKEREEKEEAKRKEREEKEEQKRKEKEEKDEQKRKEREEKEKKRQAELDAKNEEKRKKDEQREEERRKKEEEKEAEEKRKQKTAQAFQSFFVKKSTGSGGSKHSDDENSMESSGEDHQFQQSQQQAFMPFCVKGDMRLAPTCRVTLPKERKQQLEELLWKSSDDQGKQAVVVEDRDELYLGQLKSAQYQVGTMDRTWIAEEEEDGAAEDDVMIVDDDVCHQIEEDRSAVPSKRYRAKYFLFEENRRPPYRGTWRKKSENIRPRRPFVQDTKFFDYEVDSDDEWEEEEPGESLHGSDDEKDVDKEEEDYEVDNDFFVPHGHLSDEELQAEDDVADDNSPEAQKAKLKIMQQEFAAEMKKKTEKIKPRLIGCLWENGSGNERSECSAVIWEILKARAMLFDPEEPISFTTVRNEPDSNSCSPSKPGEANAPSERVQKAKMIKLVDEGVRELITMIHGCALNRSFLVKEFLAYWGKRRDDGEKVPQFAPDSIRTKILEISSWRPCPDEGPMQNKMCWYVNKEALVRYELTDLKVPTGWNFILKPIVKSKKDRKEKEKDTEGGGGGEGEEGGEEKKTPPKKKKKKSQEVNGEEKEGQSSTPSSSSKAKPAAGSAITKFTKKLSEDEKRKQFAKERKKSVGVGGTTPNHKTSEAEPKAAKPATSAKKTPAAAASPANSTEPQPKKRVQLLMSVPRGQSIPQTTKNNLISQFLAKKPTAPPEEAGSSSSKKQEKDPARMDVDEVVVLDD